MDAAVNVDVIVLYLNLWIGNKRSLEKFNQNRFNFKKRKMWRSNGVWFELLLQLRCIWNVDLGKKRWVIVLDLVVSSSLLSTVVGLFCCTKNSFVLIQFINVG